MNRNRLNFNDLFIKELMKKTLLYFLLLPVLFLSCNHLESEDYKNLLDESKGEGYLVTGVKDGDTIDLLIDGKKQIVRLANIDAPEKKQPFGNKAKQFLSDLCYRQKITLIHSNEYDQYNRLIAEAISLQGVNLNKEIVKNGLAWHYKRYSKDKTYEALENEARGLKIGLWADNNPIAPWIWRKL